MDVKEKRDESINKIMNAAMEEFSEKGYSGARVDEIAKRAAVNKAMIYYRVGDKEALYTKVIKGLFGTITSRLSDDIPQDIIPEEKLKLYIRGVTKTVAEHPYLPQIMMRELASGGSNINEFIAKNFAEILAVPSGILAEGVKKNVFNKTDPLVIHLMVVGFIMVFKSTQPLREKFFKKLKGANREFENRTIIEAMNEIEKIILRAVIK